MTWPAFAHPWLLAGLIAGGLPVLIHYLTRARPRKVAFPPFKFLLESCAGQQSIHRLRTVALLITRCLAVLALVFLFAMPFIKPPQVSATAEATQHCVLIVDASLSMRAVQGGVQLFARAKAEAADVLRGLEAGREAAVILVGASPRSLLPALSPNIPALHEALSKAEATYEAGDFQAALATAKRMLNGPGIIYIFSDFQKSNWDSAGELPAGCVCRLRPVTSEPVNNSAITAVRLLPEEPVAGESADVVCSVFNCTPQSLEKVVHVRLGEFTQEKNITVPSFGTAECSFSVAFSREGFFSGKAWLDPDDLREDDTRYIALRVHKSIQLLLLSDADLSDARSAAFFLSRSLVPTAAAVPGINIVRRHSQDADRGILETADLFVLVSPAALTGEAAEIISRRVQEGARLIVVLDGPAAPALVSSSLNAPFQLIRTVTSASGDSLVSGPRRLFAETDPGDWAAIHFFRHYENKVLAGRANDVFLSFPDGSAAISFASIGKGAAVFINLPLSPDGGDFVGNPLFPSTMHELVRLLRRSSEGPEVNPGKAWLVEAPIKGEGLPSVLDPDGVALDAQVIASGRTSRLGLPAARLPGIYVVKQSGLAVDEKVVNIDPRESDTRPIALANLKAGQGMAVSVAQDQEDLLLTGKSKPLWPQLAQTAALFLAIEMLLLALWRSHRAGKERPVPA
ncbi:MAG TPA: BatA domain-containing protein [Patescibacteria group bacterium]|nr:BatA domain-containing protein [Patescibacteria group bacterium]